MSKLRQKGPQENQLSPEKRQTLGDISQLVVAQMARGKIALSELLVDYDSGADDLTRGKKLMAFVKRCSMRKSRKKEDT